MTNRGSVNAAPGQAPYVLGIDSALDRTGVGIIELVDGRCRARTQVIGSATPADRLVAPRCRRVAQIAHQVGSLWRPLDRPPELVLIEAAALDAHWGDAHTRAGVWFAIVLPLWQAGVPVAEVAPTTLKKWATGRGGSKAHPVEKTHMVAAMHRMWPGVPATSNDLRHHECEALGLSQIGAQYLGWPVPVRRHHSDALTVIKWPDGITPGTHYARRRK